MKIVHLMPEFPFPANSGMRCDMGRRLEAFRRLGHEVFVITWAKDNQMPASEHLAHMYTLVDDLVVFPIGVDLCSRLRRIWSMRRYPSSISARIPPKRERLFAADRITAFAPDLIWAEGLHAAWFAGMLNRLLAVPIAYRSHNIEHFYMAEQARLAKLSWFKFSVTLATFGLKKAEFRFHNDAARVFDISSDDLKYWQDRGFENNEWLAPQTEDRSLLRSTTSSLTCDIDLLFIGGLTSPNNIAGLNWYLELVHPRVAAAIPDIAATIAGRQPSPNLVERARRGGVSIIADPIEAAPLLARSRVMLNPILHGSGVNIKTIDMLATGQPVVTTHKGARGLPRDVVDELDVADGPDNFASAVITAVRSARAGMSRPDRNALVERVFGVGAVAAALSNFE